MSNPYGSSQVPHNPVPAMYGYNADAWTRFVNWMAASQHRYIVDWREAVMPGEVAMAGYYHVTVKATSIRQQPWISRAIVQVQDRENVTPEQLPAARALLNEIATEILMDVFFDESAIMPPTGTY